MRKVLLAAIGLSMILLGVVLLGPNPVATQAQDGDTSEYVGSETCAMCHADKAAQTELHGHSYKLTKVDGAAPDYPFSEVTDPPEGYTWDDISFVIGGFAWTALFIDQQGYIITGDEDATTQYNLPLIDDRTDSVIREAGWVGYHAGEATKPYDSGGRHTTGYNDDPETHMYDMPGLIGTWTEEGIMCEECHGPGGDHVADPTSRNVLTTIARPCSSCHFRDDPAVIDATGGFILHHQQYEEYVVGPHAMFFCITCHDPHQSAIYADEEGNPDRGLVVECTDCHTDEETSEPHEANGVTCVECHMAPIVASGNKNTDLLWADVSSHLFRINTDPEARQFNQDGSAAMPYLTVEYVCTRCHTETSVEDLAGIAEDYHHDHD